MNCSILIQQINGKIVRDLRDSEIVKICSEIGKTVGIMHKNGIMHGDLTTSNFIVEKKKLFLIDFGLAKRIDRSKMYQGKTHTSDCGTAGYIAPEVYAKRPYSAAADMWSVGVILLEMFTGKLQCDRDKVAYSIIAKRKEKFPDKPVPNLIKMLLEEDDEKRISAESALTLPLFSKFNEPRNYTFTRRYVVENVDGASKTSKTSKTKS